MTAGETMELYAAITLPGQHNQQERTDRINEVMRAFGLASHHNTMVGGELPGEDSAK